MQGRAAKDFGCFHDKAGTGSTVTSRVSAPSDRRQDLFIVLITGTRNKIAMLEKEAERVTGKNKKICLEYLCYELGER